MAQADSIGTVADSDGEVVILRGDATPIDAAPGTEIQPGDVIVAGEDSGATVTLADGTVIQLDAGTTVTVEHVVLADGGAKRSDGWSLRSMRPLRCSMRPGFQGRSKWKRSVQ